AAGGRSAANRTAAESSVAGTLQRNGLGSKEPNRVLRCTAIGERINLAPNPKAKMLPSLQESVDVDDKELESSEEGGGLLEERKPERTSNSYYCLYSYQGCRLNQGTDSDDGSPSSTAAETPSSDDFRGHLDTAHLWPLGLVQAMPSLWWTLTYQLKQKQNCAVLLPSIFQREPFFEGMGNVASVELRQLQEACQRKFIKVRVVTTFRLELDRYIQDLKINIDAKQKNSETCIKPQLETWFEDSVCAIQRVVQLFQEKLAFVLHAALSYTPVEVKESDERTKKDINRFLRAASLQGLVQEGTMASLCIAMTEEQQKSVVIDCSGPQPQFHNAGSNKFCEDWMQAFLNGSEAGNPFLFLQILENFKLKATQDINNLKRFIRQAEMDHYALFKCFLFLRNCGSGDVLLKVVKVEHAEMQEAKNVITVLEEFMRETAVA
ncbi:hypothetical protein lerEdw1_003764, partial [Lerista edwardsae]